jgi:hypothetical protein
MSNRSVWKGPFVDPKLLKKVNDRFDVPWFNIPYWDSLASDLGCYPDFGVIKEKDTELKRQRQWQRKQTKYMLFED